ncbi:NUDIX hydrolase [Candidatus Pacearchaeota archaeon]|nr:NUDIX hydrolase [Candidatus Pacearchaeota archaeon]
MAALKTLYSPKGLVHFSVGAIIKKGDRILLIDRAVPPLGFACPAGHVEHKENFEDALLREVKEEIGMQVFGYKLLFEETLYGNDCNKGAHNHHWIVFECEVRGDERKNREVKTIGYYSKEEISKLKLEPSWNIILKKLKIIN